MGRLSEVVPVLSFIGPDLRRARLLEGVLSCSKELSAASSILEDLKTSQGDPGSPATTIPPKRQSFASASTKDGSEPATSDGEPKEEVQLDDVESQSRAMFVLTPSQNIVVSNFYFFLIFLKRSFRESFF